MQTLPLNIYGGENRADGPSITPIQTLWLLTFIQLNSCVFFIVSPFCTSYNNAVNDNHFQLRIRRKGATKCEEITWKANYIMGRGVIPAVDIISMQQL
ncbi:hypothetical protein MHB65_23950 [Lysinibacillus sp. FSL K6-0075]|uniref:hypothetical protein n=1 Tax=Lysinibacillus sp. FSL K6-0075 TaxID=2921415 RepID=UPI0031598AF3